MMKRLPILFALFLCVTATGAATRERPVGRFDHLERHRVGGSIGVEALGVEDLAFSDELRSRWEGFRAEHGPRWKILLDDRTAMPVIVSGQGIALFPAGYAPSTLQEVEGRARAFLDSQADLLGAWSGAVELDELASGRISKEHWQLIFRQSVGGVRVENSRLDMQIKFGRLVLFGASQWGEVTVSGVPALDETQARSQLDAYVEADTGGLLAANPPRLAVIAVAAEGDGAPGQAWAGPRGRGVAHRLIWRFEFAEPGAAPNWIAEVDANNGEIVSFYDGAHYATARGGVFPTTNDLDCPNGGCEVSGFPMPYADFTETGQVESFADAFGNLMCVDSLATYETNLEGPYVKIEDGCGTLAETGTCDGTLELGLKAGENCDVASGASAGNTAAARTAYYHINRIFDVARFYDSTSPWLTDQVTVKVNQPGSCNAFWNGTIRMLGEGNGCGNTGELSGVLVHEWGHGYDFNDGGGEDVTSEAYADVVAIFYNRDSCVSRGWFNDGSTCTGYGDTCLTCTGIRDHDWAARVSNTPATPLGFVANNCPSGPGGPCSKQQHCEAYPIGETIFDLATRDLPAAGLDQDTAWQLADRLWYSTRLGSGGNIYDCFRIWLTHSCFSYSWLQRMLVADDDDGDLSNGTPHAAALFAAFDRHDISCGAVSDPENQSTSSCAPLATPSLSVVEMPGSGTQLSWAAIPGAGEIRVYRNELGCNRQQVPIASLAGSATSFLDTTIDPDVTRYYRVEAFGASTACHSPVSNCVATPMSARVQPTSIEIVETGTVNGIPDPGETVTLPVTANNGGTIDSTGTTGVLTFVDPAQGQVLDGQATWANIAPSSGVESDAPHFTVEVYDSVQCGDTVSWNVATSAANSSPANKQFSVTLGVKDREWNELVSAAIPDQASPIVGSIAIAEDEEIGNITVDVSITHDHPEELVVELSSPGGTTVRLHDQTAGTGFGIVATYDVDRLPDGPGTMQDFDGESVIGTWTLSVEDVGSVGTGNLNAWKMNVTAAGAFDCEEANCSAPPPTLAPGGFAVDKQPNGNDVDLVFSWNAVSGVAGYNVLQTTDKTFTGSTQVTGTTAGSTTFTLPNGVATTPGLTYFQVRAVNVCGVEGP